MSIEEIHALAAFLVGMAAGLGLSAYLNWCDSQARKEDRAAD